MPRIFTRLLCSAVDIWVIPIRIQDQIQIQAQDSIRVRGDGCFSFYRLSSIC